ncbi:hypothetical protein [Enterococcus caccae]|uniref:hypothetical protein n=1 Tax=Enterococcus caccae TaxID=317735 RepID=UPI0012DC0C7C|nr:hypothetical protein [Enterococcus caccae]
MTFLGRGIVAIIDPNDIKGAWENTKAMGSTLKTIGLGLQGATDPWSLARNTFR